MGGLPLSEADRGFAAESTKGLRVRPTPRSLPAAPGDSLAARLDAVPGLGTDMSPGSGGFARPKPHRGLVARGRARDTAASSAYLLAPGQPVTYFTSTEEATSLSTLSPRASEEDRLPSRSPDTAFMAGSDSSRLGTVAERWLGGDDRTERSGAEAEGARAWVKVAHGAPRAGGRLPGLLYGATLALAHALATPVHPTVTTGSVATGQRTQFVKQKRKDRVDLVVHGGVARRAPTHNVLDSAPSALERGAV